MSIGSNAECELQKNQGGERKHREIGLIPQNINFFLDPLLGEPQGSKQDGSSLNDKDRPWFNGSEGDKSQA